MASNFPDTTRRLLARSSFGPELTQFASWLDARHYTPVVVHRHLLRLEQVLPRLPHLGRGATLSADDLHLVFDVVGQGAPARIKDFQATQRAYGQFLLAGGRLYGTPVAGRFSALREAYERHLRELRGLSLSSRQHHVQTVADFLSRAIGPRQELDALTRADIERYVELRSREVSRHSLQHVVAHLRAFLRFCHDRGDMGSALDSIDTPRTYRGELPPQALPWATVQTLLASIDCQSKAGWRDHCILHLMAYYGLRPSEVVSLRLDSIDWDTGVLHVMQCKTRSELLLPLAPPTLQVLRSYLAHERLRQDPPHAELFLRVRCPNGPLERTAIGDIFEKRMRLAHLQPGGHHVYRLRHTFAMRLLTQGVGVKAIGDLLGHHSLESTCAYLRLDIDMLRGVALEVPSPDCRGGCHA